MPTYDNGFPRTSNDQPIEDGQDVRSEEETSMISHADDRALARMLGVSFLVGIVAWGLIIYGGGWLYSRLR